MHLSQLMHPLEYSQILQAVRSQLTLHRTLLSIAHRPQIDNLNLNTILQATARDTNTLLRRHMEITSSQEDLKELRMCTLRNMRLILFIKPFRLRPGLMRRTIGQFIAVLIQVIIANRNLFNTVGLSMMVSGLPHPRHTRRGILVGTRQMQTRYIVVVTTWFRTRLHHLCDMMCFGTRRIGTRSLRPLLRQHIRAGLLIGLTSLLPVYKKVRSMTAMIRITHQRHDTTRLIRHTIRITAQCNPR